MTTVHYTQCPVCNSDRIHPILSAKDHTVSHETFIIWQCQECTLRFTQDVPDETSIGAYYKSEDYISHSNTSKGLLNQVYQRVRKITLAQKASLITGATKPIGKLLDIGAGTGAFVNEMKGRQWDVTGIEPDEDARKQARDLYRLELIEPHILKELPVGSFDAITLWHVLEHVHALHDYVETLKQLLSDKGRIFIAVPNYNSVDASLYGNFWAAYDVPRHLYHFTPKSIEVLMAAHGLSVIQKKPMWFDSFYISLLSTKYRYGTTRWFSALMAGIRSNSKTLVDTNSCSSVIYIISKN
jgi:2-polyprenyl-3-methyl-5-hydroxy-6-metoxy-1,4-benzoquinol methylase